MKILLCVLLSYLVVGVCYAGEKVLKLYVVASHEKVEYEDHARAQYLLYRLKYSSIEDFQKENGLKVDGWIGKKTRQKLLKLAEEKKIDYKIEPNSKFITRYDKKTIISKLKNHSKVDIKVAGLLKLEGTGFKLTDVTIDQYVQFCVKEGSMIKTEMSDRDDITLRKGTVIKPGQDLLSYKHISERYSLKGRLLLVWE